MTDGPSDTNTLCSNINTARSRSSGRVRGGAENHEIYLATFSGHLCYRPQANSSCGKVMFSQTPVIVSTGVGGGQTHISRTVRNLLECILVIVTGPPGALLFDRDQRSH